MTNNKTLLLSTLYHYLDTQHIYDFSMEKKNAQRDCAFNHNSIYRSLRYTSQGLIVMFTVTTLLSEVPSFDLYVKLSAVAPGHITRVSAV